MAESGHNRARVVIVGGGVAGIEALLALHDLAGDRAELTLVADRPDFVYRPLLVEEPFGLDPAERRELAPLAADLGAELVSGSLSEVRPERSEIVLGGGEAVRYDYLAVCIGANLRPAFDRGTTFPSPEPVTVEELLTKAHVSGSDTLVFVVPTGVAWSLPIYELALMTRRRARERSYNDLRIRIISPEEAPLVAFGTAGSIAVADTLKGRKIEFTGSTRVHQEGGELVLTPAAEPIGDAEIVALPEIRGPRIAGLPADDHGFIPVDAHSRVLGLDDVYAAGDGTNFPIKQGGLATQQADALAEHLAHRLGAAVEVEPFKPVLRGTLLTGDESVHMQTGVTGGEGEGESSLDYLWWPPHKISARYLSPFLYHADAGEAAAQPPRDPMDVEVALPHDWHEQPAIYDPEHPPRVD